MAFGLFLVATVAVSAALAQPGEGRRQGGPMYDSRTETRVTGTVEAVENVTPQGRGGRRGLGGLHVTLKSATESIEVHLGPVAFLNDKNVTVAAGDTLEVLGSRVTLDGEPVLLAREVKKGDTVWTLRDSAGRPMWSRGRR
jgi:hypothetical protein